MEVAKHMAKWPNIWPHMLPACWWWSSTTHVLRGTFWFCRCRQIILYINYRYRPMMIDDRGWTTRPVTSWSLVS
jgi:hypothetical protein